MTPTPIPRRPGLAQLKSVELDARHRKMLDAAAATSVGSASWRQRKHSEAHELLALAQISRRLCVLQLDLAHELRAVFAMKAPVPVMPNPGATHRIMPFAVVAIRYPEEAIRLPQPGSSYAAILEPHHTWHGNVSYDQPQVICLGTPTSLPAGFPAREIALRIFAAITFQGVVAELDERNPGGVLNVEAARYWQARAQSLPLSREPFIVEAA